MTANLFVYGKFRASDYSSGSPLAGGQVFTYETGTLIAKDSYTDSTGVTANTNPVILDANGEANIYLEGLYTIILQDVNGVQLWKEDGIQGSIDILTTITSTSTTSAAIATGTKTFTTQTGKAFTVGGFVLVTSNANPANFMFGQITSYSDDILMVNVTVFGGSGTHSDWTISISGPQGAQGVPGTSGAGSGDMVGSANLAVGAGGVANAATSRGNLGLGSSSTKDAGSSAGQVPILNMSAKIDSSLLDTGTNANQIVELDGSAKLPAVDGSQLTNLPSSGTFASGSISGSSTSMSTSISSLIKRIVVAIDTNASIGVEIGIRLGDSGGIESSGYSGSYSENGGTSTSFSSLVHIGASGTAALVEFMRIGSTNEWIFSGCYNTSAGTGYVAGTKTTSAATDRISVVGSSLSGNYSISLLTA